MNIENFRRDYKLLKVSLRFGVRYEGEADPDFLLIWSNRDGVDIIWDTILGEYFWTLNLTIADMLEYMLYWVLKHVLLQFVQDLVATNYI